MKQVVLPGCAEAQGNFHAKDTSKPKGTAAKKKQWMTARGRPQVASMDAAPQQGNRQMTPVGWEAAGGGDNRRGVGTPTTAYFLREASHLGGLLECDPALHWLEQLDGVMIT